MKTNILFFLMFIISGCTTIQTSLNTSPIPANRIFLNSKINEKDTAEIIIIRDRSLAGSICYYAIYIDDVLSARIGSSEKFTLNVAPGQRKLKITRDPQGDYLCSSGDDMTEKMIDISNSEKKHFRLSTSISGWPELQSITIPK